MLSFDRRVAFWILFLPPIIWLGLFFVVPLLLMAVFSFSPQTSGSLLAGWTPTLKQYAAATSNAGYWRLLGISVIMALSVALVSILLSYPIAYFLAFRAGRRANLFLVLLLVPFWTSYLLRVMAWKFMLGSEGLINSFLEYIQVIQQPLTALLYNRNAVVVTLIYVWIPFTTLPILAALQRIDLALFEAAADLGATPLWQFLRVTLPLSMPGVLAAFFMVFIPTVGEYVTPLLVGGSRGTMFGNIIQEFFTRNANWPRGAALSVVMLAVTLLLVAFARRFVSMKAAKMTATQSTVSEPARFSLL